MYKRNWFLKSFKTIILLSVFYIFIIILAKFGTVEKSVEISAVRQGCNVSGLVSNKSRDARTEYNFSYVINKPLTCSRYNKNDPTQLLLLISTTYEHKIHRNSLRQTWLTYSKKNTANVRYIFILGETEDKDLTDSIKEENEQNNDIIVVNFKDSYRNLTLKTLAGFHWAVKYCTSVRFVMKTDDDVYVNIPGLVSKLKQEDDSHSMGHLRTDGKPFRTAGHKWYISHDEYPSPTYPGYLDGLGYVLSLKLVKDILRVYPYINYTRMPFEDVYVGLCLKQAGYKYNHEKFYKFIRRELVFPLCFYKYSNVIAVHGVPEYLLDSIWKEPCPERGPLSDSYWIKLVRHLQETKTA